MLYFQWRHLAVTGEWYGSFMEFVLLHRAGFSPMWFGEIGFHLWFLGFLFSFSLLALPIFLWLKGASGQAFMARLTKMCSPRGGILVLALPLIAVRLVLHAIFPQEHDWADFFSQMTFFVLGYVLYAHAGFTAAIKRDRWILLAAAILSSAAWAYLALTTENFNPEAPIRTARYALIWAVIMLNGWSWSTFMLALGMRSLDFTNRRLEYAQAAALPFFLLHQPVIIAIAFFVVQWNAGIPVKLPVVVIGSFVVSLAIYELVIRRIRPLRLLFGMK